MSDDLVTIEINGRPLKARKGAMVIQVADEAGIDIPRFCYHKKLSIAANCRMCLVEVEKAPKPLPACATPVADGMKVYTNSPKAIAAQKATMEFLLINHPLDCPICDQGGECELQDLAMGYGGDVSRYHEKKRVVKDKNLGPLISADMTRCIHCTRCVRFGEEIAGLKELGATGRGEHMRIGTYVERAVTSEMSSNVIDLCPVGALTSKPFRFRARPWELVQHESVAPHDSVGSNIFVHTLRGRVMRVVPRDNEEVNETWISDRDRFSYEGLYADDRLTVPMVREDDAWYETDWDTALEAAVKGVRRVIEAHGADMLGALASPTATLEELYLLQKLVRGLGSNNLDHRLRQGDFSDQDAAPVYPWLGMPIADLERLQAVLLIGSNVRMEQPIIAHRLRKASMAGAALMFVNPVDFEFRFRTAEKFITDPAGMVAALAGVAKAILDHAGGTAPAALEPLLAGVEIGEAHRAAAERLKGADRSAVLLGNLAVASPHYSALRALAGLIADLSGAALGYLPDAGNSVGGWLAGVLPHRGPGGAGVDEPGLNARDMLESPRKAYFLLGVEAERDSWNPAAATAALRQAECVVCLSPYASDAMKEYAHVLLPVGLFPETSGTFVNLEGRWQSVQGTAQPPGEARPAWKVLRVLGNLFALEGFEYTASDQVRDDLRQLAEGVTPDNRVKTPGSIPAPARPAGLVRVADVPIYAVDSLVRRSRPLQETVHAVEAAVRVSAAMAAQLGVEDGDRVRVKQGMAQCELPVVVDERVAPGCAWIPAAVAGSETLGAAWGPVEIEKT